MQPMPSVTVAVMPREKFGCAERSLRSLLDNTPGHFDLIYIDAGSPRTVQTALDGLLSTRKHCLHRVERYLSPFEATAIAIDTATTDYLVLADNDVYFRPGWLDALLRCATEQEADAVVPLVLIGDELSEDIHVAAGHSRLEVGGDGATHLKHHQFHEWARRSEVTLERGRTELLESHCVMARLDTWRGLGDLDPTVGHPTNVDELSLRLGEIGAAAWFEPAAEVVYLFGPDIRYSVADIRLMSYVWSERWVARDFQRLADQRGVRWSRPDTRRRRWWMANQRRAWLRHVKAHVQAPFNAVRMPVLGHICWKGIEYFEQAANRLYIFVVTRVGWARSAAVAHGLRKR